jgi:hypothetical protein
VEVVAVIPRPHPAVDDLQAAIGADEQVAPVRVHRGGRADPAELAGAAVEEIEVGDQPRGADAGERELRFRLLGGIGSHAVAGALGRALRLGRRAAASGRGAAAGHEQAAQGDEGERDRTRAHGGLS